MQTVEPHCTRMTRSRSSVGNPAASSSASVSVSITPITPTATAAEDDHDEVMVLSPSPEKKDDDDNVENLIRIRSSGELFENDDDDDDGNVEDDDFGPLPLLIEMGTSGQSRKRKQELSTIENDLNDIIQIEDEVEFLDSETNFDYDPELYQYRKRERDKTPLYLLNPDDYTHDPRKQVQIRRAHITFRHHQEKKLQIFELKDENQRLRSYVEELKLKVLELSNCGCSINKESDLSILDVTIPCAPDRVYRVKPLFGTQSSPPSATLPQVIPKLVKLAHTQSSNSKKSADGGAPIASQALTITADADNQKPFINIASTRLQHLSPTRSSAVSIRSSGLTRPLVTAASGNSGKLAVTNPTSTFHRTIISNGVVTTMSHQSEVKSEPIQSTATSSAPAPTASQLLFAAKMQANSTKPMMNQTPVSTISSHLFSSQQTLPKPATPVNSNSIPITANNVRMPPGTSTIAQSTSLRIPQQCPNARMLPGLSPIVRSPSVRIPPHRPYVRMSPGLSPMPRTPQQQNPRPWTTATKARTIPPAAPRQSTGPRPRYQTIFPKPHNLVMMAPATQSPFKQEVEVKSEDLKAMWQSLDTEEDELAIIAAIHQSNSMKTNSGPPPPKMGRKQTIQDRYYNGVNRGPKSIVSSNGTEIQLENYTDLVFEVADD